MSSKAIKKIIPIIVRVGVFNFLYEVFSQGQLLRTVNKYFVSLTLGVCLSNNWLLIVSAALDLLKVGWKWKWCLSNKSPVPSFNLNNLFQLLLIFMASFEAVYLSVVRARTQLATQCVVRNPECSIFSLFSLAIGEGKYRHSKPGVNCVCQRISLKNVVAFTNVERQFGHIRL